MGRKSDLKSQLDRIVFLVIKEEYVSAPFIQRRLGITYPSAQLILQKLNELGYVEEYKPNKKLKVLKHQFIQ